MALDYDTGPGPSPSRQARSLGREVESLLSKHAAQKYSLEQFERENDTLKARVHDLESENSKLGREVSYLAEAALTATKGAIRGVAMGGALACVLSLSVLNRCAGRLVHRAGARQIAMMNKENMDLKKAIEKDGQRIKSYSTQVSRALHMMRLWLLIFLFFE